MMIICTLNIKISYGWKDVAALLSSTLNADCPNGVYGMYLNPDRGEYGQHKGKLFLHRQRVHEEPDQLRCDRADHYPRVLQRHSVCRRHRERQRAGDLAHLYCDLLYVQQSSSVSYRERKPSRHLVCAGSHQVAQAKEREQTKKQEETN